MKTALKINMLKKRKRKPLNTKKAAVILCVLLCAVLFMLSPVFSIKNIEITTMDKYSKDEFVYYA